MRSNDEMSDRRHFSMRDMATSVVLLMNFGGLVWGAATMSNSLKTLRETTDRLDKTVSAVTTKMETIQLDYSSRMAVLENRVSANERQIVEINQRTRGY